MKLKIDRRWPKAGYTIGNLYVSGKKLCNILEDTDRGLLQSMPVGKINQLKTWGKTAIPKGTYKVVLSVSPKFKDRAWGKKYDGLVPEILNVKGFSAVRIHPGNRASDTDGCPLCGDNSAVGRLTNSTKRYYELMDLLVPAWEKGEEIILEIV